MKEATATGFSADRNGVVPRWVVAEYDRSDVNALVAPATDAMIIRALTDRAAWLDVDDIAKWIVEHEFAQPENPEGLRVNHEWSDRLNDGSSRLRDLAHGRIRSALLRLLDSGQVIKGRHREYGGWVNTYAIPSVRDADEAAKAAARDEADRVTRRYDVLHERAEALGVSARRNGNTIALSFDDLDALLDAAERGIRR